MPLLKVQDLSLAFGGVIALDQVSFEVEPQQIVGLIGPNGAGKTSLFNCLSGLYRSQSGDIVFRDRSTTSLAPNRIARLGIARTFQNLALFESMTVLENVMVGAHGLSRSGFLRQALALPAAVRDERMIGERARALLEHFELGELSAVRVADLPFGSRKRVELARALAAAPQLLLLDEPAGGLNHQEVQSLADTIRGIRDTHRVAVLLVEHHMNLVMQVSDKVVALDFGRKIADGTPGEVQRNETVIRAYLGSAE